METGKCVAKGEGRCSASFVFTMAATALIALMAVTAAEGAGDAGSSELEELRHEASVLEKVRDLDEVLATIRDHVRPSDLIEKKVIKESGWGTLIDESSKLAEQLGSEFASAPQWLKGSLAKAKAAKQVAAAADLPTRLMKAIKQSKSSSAADKLKDLGQVISDMKTVVGVLASANPVVGAYLTVLTKAIDSIAESAKVIAAATERTNRAIEEAGKSLGPKSVRADESHALDEAIQGVRERIYTIESENNAKAFAEVTAAETACAKKVNATRKKMIALRMHVEALDRAVKRKEMAYQLLDHEQAAIGELIKATDREISRLEALSKSGGPGALEAIRKLDAEKVRKKMYEDEQTVLGKQQPARKSALAAELKADRARLDELRPQLASFEACLGCRLSSAKFATKGYLLERFPAYVGKGLVGAKFLGPLPYVNRQSSPFSRTDYLWFHVEDFNDKKVNAKGLSGGGKPSSTFSAELIDAVDGDAWWGPGSLDFSFSSAALGSYPTDVGLVWTDGGPGASVTVEVWDACGGSKKFGPYAGFADNDNKGGRAEDRFFGIVSTAGISRIHIENTPGGIEVDDLQYGRRR